MEVEQDGAQDLAADCDYYLIANYFISSLFPLFF
jgi:hypothetical protein